MFKDRKFVEIAEEIRSTLRESGWKLFLYPNKRILKTHHCTGVCLEQDCRILLALDRLSRSERFLYLAHEFAHFLQAKSLTKRESKRIDRAFHYYWRRIEAHLPLKSQEERLVWEVVPAYEYEAEKIAYHWLCERGIRIPSAMKDANIYNLVVRHSIETGQFISVGRPLIGRSLQVPNRWLSPEEISRSLSANRRKSLKRIFDNSDGKGSVPDRD